MKKLVLSLVLLVALGGLATIAYAASGACERYTTCLAASAGEDGGASLDAIPQVFVETNSTVAMIPVFFIPTGTSNDTGTEVAALLGVDCQDVYAIDPAGGAGDEMTDGTCATDVADSAVGIMFTK